MSHGGFSFEMERALEDDAANLVAMDADPGLTLEELKDGDMDAQFPDEKTPTYYRCLSCDKMMPIPEGDEVRYTCEDCS